MKYECITVCGINLVPLPNGMYVTESVLLYFTHKSQVKLAKLQAARGEELDKRSFVQCMDEVKNDILSRLTEVVLSGDDGKKYRYAMFSEIPEDYDEYV